MIDITVEIDTRLSVVITERRHVSRSLMREGGGLVPVASSRNPIPESHGQGSYHLSDITESGFSIQASRSLLAQALAEQGVRGRAQGVVPRGCGG